jgi:hypothetical protein
MSKRQARGVTQGFHSRMSDRQRHPPPKSSTRTMRSRLLKGMAILLCMLPGLARAAPHGTALVIGIGTYDNKPLLPACIRIAHAVSTHLRASGFAVDELTDPDGIVLRSAVGDFADAVLAKNPSAPALIYVCARASTLDHRIFLLPADATPQAMLRLQTEGTVLRALMNTFTGNNAMLVADLGISANAADIAAAASDRPDALHVALRAGLGDQLGRFGNLLATSTLDVSAPANSGASPDTLWDRLAATLRAGADPGTGVAIAVTPASAVAEQSPVPAPSPTPPAQTALPPDITAAQLPPPTAATAPSPDIASSREPQPEVAAIPSASSNVPSAAQAPKPAAPPTPAAAPALTNAVTQAQAQAQRPASPSQQQLASASQPPLHPAPVTPSNHTTEPHSDSRTSRIQEALARHGFYHGQIDGVASPRYTAAIRAFQTSLGDSPSGGLTQIEVVKLLNAW